VRHCLDFSNVAFAMSADLSEQQRGEMVGFFERELRTDNWLRALSPWDPDAAYSVRPDHQWNGAYTAWPADAARALVLLGRGDLAAAWLDGLARSANQGPFAQALSSSAGGALPSVGRRHPSRTMTNHGPVRSAAR
jgi:hypothetical protein